MKMLKVILCGLFYVSMCLNLCFSEQGESTDIQTKIAIEKNLEDRLTKVLKQIIGTEDIIVIVNARIFSEKERKEITIRPVRQKEESILPGIPFKEDLLPIKQEMIAPLDMGVSKTLVKSLSATIIIDRSISKSVVEIAREISSGLLGIDAGRGDKLDVKQMDFKRVVFSWRMLIYPPHIYWIIGIFLAMVFVLSSVKLFFEPFKKFAPNLITTIQSQLSNRERQTEAERMPEYNPANIAIAGQPALSKEKLPFSFIDENVLPKLQYVIETETPENISTMLNFVEPIFSSRIFSLLKPELQSQVVINMSKVKELNPQEVIQTEQRIKNKINYLFGGEETIRELLDYSDKVSQEKIFTTVSKTQPDFASRLRKVVFDIESIADLDNQSILTILRQIGHTALAQVLKTFSEDKKTKILNALPVSVQGRIKEEIELARPITDQQFIEIKKRIIGVTRNLQKGGTK